jgi:hypothetical protein
MSVRIQGIVDQIGSRLDIERQCFPQKKNAPRGVLFGTEEQWDLPGSENRMIRRMRRIAAEGISHHSSGLTSTSTLSLRPGL